MRKQEGLPPKLQKRLLSSFLIVIGMMMLINIGSLGWLGTYYRSLSDKLMQHVEIHAITVELQSISQSVGN